MRLYRETCEEQIALKSSGTEISLWAFNTCVSYTLLASLQKKDVLRERSPSVPAL